MSARPIRSAGFTATELLVTIVVVAILATVAFYVSRNWQENSRSAQDLQKLRQINGATQSYLKDNNNTYFAADRTWMSQLVPKYLADWTLLQSPFDERTPGPDGENSPVSYGINSNLPGTASGTIANPPLLVVFAPAQDSSKDLTFDGTTESDPPGVTIYKAASSPGGSAMGGTHKGRKKINVLFADQRAETIDWQEYLKDEHWFLEPPPATNP